MNTHTHTHTHARARARARSVFSQFQCIIQQQTHLRKVILISVRTENENELILNLFLILAHKNFDIYLFCLRFKMLRF